MNRSTFIAGAAAVVGFTPAIVRATPAIEGEMLTQAAVFGSLPRPKPGEWTRMLMGIGAVYQKQIGVGIETAADGTQRKFYEMQVGSPGGDCNPNSLRKAYLKSSNYGSLIDVYPLISNIGRTANLVFRYADVTDPGKDDAEDTRLRLLDQKLLYDGRAMRIVSVAAARIVVAGRTVETTHIVGQYARSEKPGELLRRIDLWHTPAFPFGVAKYRATLTDMDPFELQVYESGRAYVSDLKMPLERVRAITQDGQYGHIPADSPS